MNSFSFCQIHCILEFTDDILKHIVRYINEPKGFRNISIANKRFNSISKSLIFSKRQEFLQKIEIDSGSFYHINPSGRKEGLESMNFRTVKRHYLNGLLHGESVIMKFSNERLTENYKNGILHGEWILDEKEYNHESDNDESKELDETLFRVRRTKTYVDGLIEGVEKSYERDGSTQTCTYLHDIMHGPFEILNVHIDRRHHANEKHLNEDKILYISTVGNKYNGLNDGIIRDERIYESGKRETVKEYFYVKGICQYLKEFQIQDNCKIVTGKDKRSNEGALEIYIDDIKQLELTYKDIDCTIIYSAIEVKKKDIIKTKTKLIYVGDIRIKLTNGRISIVKRRKNLFKPK